MIPLGVLASARVAAAGAAWSRLGDWTSKSFSVDLGPESTTRDVIIAEQVRSSTSPGTVTEVSVNGVGFTADITAGATRTGLGIWRGRVPTGGTVPVTLTAAGTPRVAIYVIPDGVTIGNAHLGVNGLTSTATITTIPGQLVILSAVSWNGGALTADGTFYGTANTTDGHSVASDTSYTATWTTGSLGYGNRVGVVAYNLS